MTTAELRFLQSPEYKKYVRRFGDKITGGKGKGMQVSISLNYREF